MTTASGSEHWYRHEIFEYGAAFAITSHITSSGGIDVREGSGIGSDSGICESYSKNNAGTGRQVVTTTIVPLSRNEKVMVHTMIENGAPMLTIIANHRKR